jgi:tRNA 5-methylaminomethyl-2-thiouridine biosynthesis bifunctional protein
MSETLAWQADGTPFSPRFQDRYRGENGGLAQARDVFLGGCDLPAAWAGQPKWCVLETGFGLGLNFLLTWQAWQMDPARPKLLHVVSTEAFPVAADDLLRAAQAHPALMPFAIELHAQFWGLLPGVHRLAFAGGKVLLTLLIGEAHAMLRAQVGATWRADSVYLDGFSPDRNPDIWNADTLKAVARRCRPGTRAATWTVARSVRDALTQCGFIVTKAPGAPPKRDRLEARFEPSWITRRTARHDVLGAPVSASEAGRRCVVIGAGLAGAATAASLARRGWLVTVIDRAAHCAAGASSLPAGVLAPHVSSDDSVLSQLSRTGVRMTLQQAEPELIRERDWSPSGVLERLNMDASKPSARRAPAAWETPACQAAAHDWLRPADRHQLQAAGLIDAGTPALWHARAGWITPAALVRAWLNQPGISFEGGKLAAQLLHSDAGWQVLDAAGDVLATGERIVLAAGPDTAALLPAAARTALSFQPIRGQITLSREPDAATARWPAFAVNGHGSFISGVPNAALAGSSAGGPMWLAGATYQRGIDRTAPQSADDAFNLQRLGELLPHIDAISRSSDLQAWAGVRCATPHRLPAVGPIPMGDQLPEETASLWICTGMGSRGLTFAALCGELLAAIWHGEPLPVSPKLARALLPRAAPQGKGSRITPLPVREG